MTICGNRQWRRCTMTLLCVADHLDRIHGLYGVYLFPSVVTLPILLCETTREMSGVSTQRTFCVRYNNQLSVVGVLLFQRLQGGRRGSSTVGHVSACSRHSSAACWCARRSRSVRGQSIASEGNMVVRPSTRCLDGRRGHVRPWICPRLRSP